ncbi:MAG: IS110 family transposase [Terracidiphilus sp.]|jgi:transposase
MIIVGCDFHPKWQQVAVLDAETGEIGEHKLMNGDGQAEQFYCSLPAPALVGIEACGNSQWFIDMLERLGHEVWIGDAAQIRASYVRKQKTDRRDAGHILRLLIEKRFPRLWQPTAAERDLRQLLIHRHKLVEIRTRVKNGLQHLALNRGMQKQHSLWGARGMDAFKNLSFEGWSEKRRGDLLRLLAELDERVEELDTAVTEAAQSDARARLLMTQPGVGPITALAFAVTIGDVSRFPTSGQVASYLGLIPGEHSSGGKQRLGAITKQGNRFMRQLLVEAVQTTNRLDEGFRRQYQARCHKKPKGVAKVAAARKLTVRLYWMLKTNTSYPQIAHIESSSGVPMVAQAHRAFD